MDRTPLQYELPRWAAAIVVLFILGTLGYGIVVRGSLVEPVLWWLGALRIAVGLFVVYLFYRFVVAVEAIAEKL